MFTVLFFLKFFFRNGSRRDKDDNNKSKQNASRSREIQLFNTYYYYMGTTMIYGWHGNYIRCRVAYSRPPRLPQRSARVIISIRLPTRFVVLTRLNIQSLRRGRAHAVAEPTPWPSPLKLFRAGLEWLTTTPNARNIF